MIAKEDQCIIFKAIIVLYSSKSYNFMPASDTVISSMFYEKDFDAHI